MIAQLYQDNLRNWSDIQAHLPRLRSAAKGNVLEIGVRNGVSTSALLSGVEEHGGHLWSVDINDCSIFTHPQWTFIHADSIKDKELILKAIPSQLDLLFIDGDHTYDGALSDLRTYGPLAKQILVHDVECPLTFPGVRKALEAYAQQINRACCIFPESYGLGVIYCE